MGGLEIQTDHGNWRGDESKDHTYSQEVMYLNFVGDTLSLLILDKYFFLLLSVAFYILSPI